ncbi:P-loop containing nucleoside triphosphate hydrolase protein [Scleroderma citrinum]
MIATSVMGPTGVGKSSFIHSIIPPEVSDVIRVGHRLQSETSQVQPIYLDNNKTIKLVDTPGFDDSRENLTDVDVLEMIASFIMIEWKRGACELVGLIYIHRISDTRVGGTSQRNLRMFRKLCGDESMKNVVIVTTMWDKVTTEEGGNREQELMSSDNLFKPLLNKGAIMMRHDRTPESATNVVKYLLNRNATITQIVREIAYERKALVDTKAGEELQAEIRHLMKKHAEEIRQLEEEINAAAQEEDKTTVDGLVAEKQKLENDQERLMGELGKLKRRSNEWRCARSSVLFAIADDSA